MTSVTTHLIAVVLVIVVFITPATAVLARALPEDRQAWWFSTWIMCAVVLWLTPNGAPVFVGLGLAFLILVAAIVVYKEESEWDEVSSTAFPQPERCSECGNRQNWKAIWRRPRDGEHTIVAWICGSCGYRQDVAVKKQQAKSSFV